VISPTSHAAQAQRRAASASAGKTMRNAPCREAKRGIAPCDRRIARNAGAKPYQISFCHPLGWLPVEEAFFPLRGMFHSKRVRRERTEKGNG